MTSLEVGSGGLFVRSSSFDYTQAQYIFAPNGGHDVVDSFAGSDAFSSIFQSALRGDFVSCDEINSSNSESPVALQYTSRQFLGGDVSTCQDPGKIQGLD
jgi:hypothetical protein